MTEVEEKELTKLMLKCPECKDLTWSYGYAENTHLELIKESTGWCECSHCSHGFKWKGEALITKGVKAWKKLPVEKSTEAPVES